MEPVQTYRGDWVVQFPNGDPRPGVFETESAANAAMYVPAPKIQAYFVRGVPISEERIREIARMTGAESELIRCKACGSEIERGTPEYPFEQGWRLRAAEWFCSLSCIKSHDAKPVSDAAETT